jgi:hypothetical protein
MTDKNGSESESGNDNADGMAGRAPQLPPHATSRPTPLASGALTDTQRGLVHAVIALAESADMADATRARRRSTGEFDACRMPEFGADVSALVPASETLDAKAFIDGQCRETRTGLVTVMLAGREQLHLTPASVTWLLSHAATIADYAGSYMMSKTHLARYLREGLEKFESFTGV